MAEIDFVLESDTLVAPSILKGVLHLHLEKPTRIKSIHLVFSGQLRARWTQVAFGDFVAPIDHDQLLIHQRWPVPVPRDLAAGDHAFDFNLPVLKELPVTCHVGRSYRVHYQLKATLQRSLLTPNKTFQQDVTLTHSISTARQRIFVHSSKYTIFIPSNMFRPRDVMPVTIDMCEPGWHMDVNLKEYASCGPIDRLFDGHAPSDSKQVYSSHHDISTSCHLDIPLNDLQYDVKDDQVHVYHRLKFDFSRRGAASSVSIPILIHSPPDTPPSYENIFSDSIQ